jgi:hypothetical protein
MNDCILKRPDYLELTDVPTAAAERVYSLMTELKATLDMEQVALLSQIEEMTVLEISQSQDGLVRRLCSCDDCRNHSGEFSIQ